MVLLELLRKKPSTVQTNNDPQATKSSARQDVPRGAVAAYDFPPTVDTMILFPEIENGVCVFPFWYRHERFYDCVKFNAKHKWCSLNSTFKGYWKYCSQADFATCAFPFWFRRVIYWECTEDEASLCRWG
uniref:binder of sperm protein homolog 1-like n=1 Tax=Jaculus jaculus TaxID=51337 RepID=UPI001E1B0492|nr:binder of sperm protein homolog 1-like [Jaculus jaculus]